MENSKSKWPNLSWARHRHYEEPLATFLRQYNDAIRDVHKSGLDVDISTKRVRTQRGQMVQVDLCTFRLGALRCDPEGVVQTTTTLTRLSVG